MAEPQKQQMGDGSDNIGQAAGQAAKAAKNAGKQAAKLAAKKGAEAAANAAAATVKAGVEGGKAVAEIAAGTAAGGPWGAIISAAWAMRHTLFKILVCLCLSVVFLIVMIVELPGIIINKALGIDGNEPTVSITEIYENLSETVSDIVHAGYDASMAEVERLISDGGYDRELSMNALINYAQSSAGYDTAYILSAYSTSVEQLSNDPEDMKKKLDGVAAKMFPVTSVERENEVITPVTYYTYKPVTITVVTKTVKTGVINGVPQYRYETAEATYYLQDQQLSSDTQIEVDAYSAVTLTLPIYSGSNITGTRKATYYQYTGKETLTPEKKTVKYLECTIHPFDNTVISTAFGLDLNASYNGLETTYGDVIHSRALALKKTLYGTAGNGSTVPLTDVELIAFLARQNCSETRKHIVKTGLSLVGKVPYFWGGKSAAGWNDEWNTPKLVTAAGSTTTGTIRPFGLDCSGFSDWTYKTAVGVSLNGASWSQWDESYAITAEELLPGDLGFLMDDDGGGWNHVLIFAGYGENGERMWVHSSGGEGVIFNTPSYEAGLALRRPKNVDFGDTPGQKRTEESWKKKNSIQPLPFLQTIPTPERYSAECWNRGMRSRH